MKIVVLGSTLYSSVTALLLAETGHDVSWILSNGQNNPLTSKDALLNQRLKKMVDAGQLALIARRDCASAQNGTLPESIAMTALMPEILANAEVILLGYHPSELALARLDLSLLPPAIAPRLMLNGSTFGLHGTEKLRTLRAETTTAELMPEGLETWVYFPDVIQEGNAVNSFVYAKEVIVGVENDHARMIMREILRPFFPRDNQYLFMPILDAEFAKLSISGMLATRISYMNDLARVAETLGVDIINVKQGLGADSRIGASYLSPGVGFGGENFSHDILTLTEEVTKSGAKSHLLSQVWAINESQKELLFRKLWCHFETHLAGKVIGIWGASFKENTPSIHNSPIHNMLQALWAQGVIVQLHDPEALGEIARVYGEREDLILCDSRYAATKNADALCVLTAWREYFSPDYARLKTEMKEALILDGRNIYDPEYVEAQGFSYEGVGRA